MYLPEDIFCFFDCQTQGKRHFTCLVLNGKILPKEVRALEKEADLYNAVYKEIVEIVGLEAMQKLYQRFKGQQVTFPVRLYSPLYIQQSVIKEFDGSNIALLAQKYDYSERTIRRMLRDSKDNK